MASLIDSSAAEIGKWPSSFFYISSILLLVGINKKKHIFMLPWIIIETIFFILGIIAVVAIIIIGSVALYSVPFEPATQFTFTVVSRTNH